MHTHQRLQGREDTDTSAPAKGRVEDEWGHGSLGLAPSWMPASFSYLNVRGYGGGGVARRGSEPGGVRCRGNPGPRPCPMSPVYDSEHRKGRSEAWASAPHACSSTGANRRGAAPTPSEEYRLISVLCCARNDCHCLRSRACTYPADVHASAHTHSVRFSPERARHLDARRLLASQMCLHMGDWTALCLLMGE
jgi:hypothetical protein